MRIRPDALLGAGWVALGLAIAAAAWRMDRLEALHVNPWSAPGLVPGVLGALMAVFGAALCLRMPGDEAGRSDSGRTRGRTWLALILCVGFAGGVLGHGLPFWLAAAGFLFVSIAVFRWLDAVPPRKRIGRLALESAVIALIAGGAISLLFQEVFLIRLP